MQDAIDNLAVGGRNYILNSGSESSSSAALIARYALSEAMGEGFLEGQREQAKIIRNASRYLTEEAQGGIVVGSTHNDNRQTIRQDSSVNLTGNSFYIRSDRDIHDLAVEIATLTRTQQRGRDLRMA